jgi:hypothetical protein
MSDLPHPAHPARLVWETPIYDTLDVDGVTRHTVEAAAERHYQPRPYDLHEAWLSVKARQAATTITTVTTDMTSTTSTRRPQ